MSDHIHATSVGDAFEEKIICETTGVHISLRSDVNPCIECCAECFWKNACLFYACLFNSL